MVETGLRKIAAADDRHIVPFREDGKTYGTPTWIWSVAVGDALFVRAYNGQKSRWYPAAVGQKEGRILAMGMTKEVTFERVDGPINDRIDEAYRAKYPGSPYLRPMIGARTRAATVKVMPREAMADNREGHRDVRLNWREEVGSLRSVGATEPFAMSIAPLAHERRKDAARASQFDRSGG